jgi:PAS domain S-box-containing protein
MGDELLLTPLLDDIARLQDRVGGRRARQPILDEALRNLEQSIEELKVAAEELQVKNEELLLALSELDAERRRYRDLFDNATSGFLITDGQDVLVETNRAAGELAGRPAESLIGSRLQDLVEPGGRQELLRRARRIRQGQPCEIVLTLAGPAGHGRLVRVLGRQIPQVKDGGPHTHWTLIDLDGPILESETATEGDTGLVRRWLGIYGELVGVTESLLETVLDRADGLSREARQHFLESEVQPVEARLWRLRRRRDHWARRHDALVGLELDMEAGELRYRDRSIKLTHREQQLLRFLAQRPGTFFPPRALLVRAWHASYLSEEQLRTYVARLRRKLELLEVPCQLVTRRQEGYALVFD